MTTKQERIHRLISSLENLGFTFAEIHQLRRIEMTLSRWSEHECGDSNDRFSRSIERDETTGKPYWCIRWHDENKVRRTACPDREAGALKRLAAIMHAHPDLWSYHQSDPRGVSLYVGRKQDITPTDNPIVTKAVRLGLKFTVARASMPGPGGAAIYATDAFPHRLFDTPEEAARAFLKQRGEAVPNRNFLPVDQFYTRGIAVAA